MPRIESVPGRTRRYDSTLRRRMARENRQSILEAATTLFAERGWSSSVRDIAAAAGVSVEGQRLTVHIAAAMVADREVSAAESDGLWAVLTQEVYELLTERVGWSPAQYEEWLTETIIRLLQLES